MRSERQEFHQVDTLAKVHPWIARIAVLFGTLAAGTSLARGSKDPFRDVLSISADTLTMGAWASEALGGYVATEQSTALVARLGLKAGQKIAAEFALRAFALQLSLFASIVGVCALAWSLRPDLSEQRYGAEAVAIRYLNAALGPGGPFDGKRDSVLRAFNKAAVSLQRRLSDLMMHIEPPSPAPRLADWQAGSPASWGPDEPPTWWVCSAMGLTRGEIAYLFAQPEEALTHAGIPKSRRGKRKFVE